MEAGNHPAAPRIRSPEGRELNPTANARRLAAPWMNPTACGLAAFPHRPQDFRKPKGNP